MQIKVRSFFQWLSRRRWWLVGSCVILLVLIFGPTIAVYALTDARRFAAADIQKVPPHKVAIVFGAGVLPDGTPTPYLKRRLDTAVELYKNGQAKMLLLSGDNSTSHHNEPLAMKRYAVLQGVIPEDIVLDYAGFNTYDSCYRARAIFNVQTAVLVTHDYHLPRAVLTCSSLGIESVGLAAKNTGKAGRDFSINYIIRELASTDKALFQIVFKPFPTALGNPEPI